MTAVSKEEKKLVRTLFISSTLGASLLTHASRKNLALPLQTDVRRPRTAAPPPAAAPHCTLPNTPLRRPSHGFAASLLRAARPCLPAPDQ